ncbi:MAG: hypothetical protein ABSC95_16645 [Acetobacteraceae bacterium]|jgi:hypothetical protein
MSSALWNYRTGAAAWRGLLIAATLLALAGCGGSKAVQIRAPDYADHSARTLAIAPVDDLFVNDDSQLADAIGVELAKRGYSVVDAKGTAALLAKYGISPVEVLAPKTLTALGKEGVDAVVSVSSEGSVMGGPGMRHAKARVTSTRTAKDIGEIDWNNSWGGMPGSPADYTMRKGPAGAAREIAEELAKLLG